MMTAEDELLGCGSRQLFQPTSPNRRTSTGEGEHDDAEFNASLPPEIVFHIFSFLPADEIRKTVPLVCHTWKALAGDEMLWKCLLQREFRLTFSEEVVRHMDVRWSAYYYALLEKRTDFDASYNDPDKKILGCQHYQRNVKILAECCQRFFAKGPACLSPVCQGKHLALYYCSVCNFWDNTPGKSIFHCPDCNVCYLGRGLGVDYYHCTECNMCFDKRYQASHKHITHKKMVEVVPPVDEEEAEG
ncbi:Fbox domain containing protein [Acanthamoeba castellanii str. Neff]|uniref:Fbox domain containing protein n=1 Tax=Acanthamoeba castellanii (strain ATCC 30010 / Neff) TaxID=1257118 RepID=L8GQP8_ACACF|nr:Fbox domain containing protein [Acanthamoeba castellanii str. Neff]ELR15227.1 Fbox domain containing protein [Acanthamoeba castellanii str. Neff]